MKKLLLICFFALVFAPVYAGAQTGEKQALQFDKILEADASHNLEVAWQYFKLKKAYVAVLMRTDETIAAHPTFSKADQVLYLAGMSSYYLSIGKGKQKIDPARLSEEDRKRFSTERLHEDALAYLDRLIEMYPQSKYAKKAAKTLKKIRTAGQK